MSVIPFPDIPNPKDLLPKGVDRPGKIISDLRDILEKEKDSILNKVDEQTYAIEQDIKRFDEIIKKKVKDNVYVSKVLAAKKKLEDKVKYIKTTRDTIFDQYKTREELFIKTLTNLRIGITDEIYHDLHLDELKEWKDRVIQARDVLDKITKGLANLGIESDKWNKILHSAKTDAEKAAAKKELQRIEKDIGKQSIVKEEKLKQFEQFTKNVKKVKDKIKNISVDSVMSGIKKEINGVATKIAKDIDKFKDIKNEFKDVQNLMRTGYEDIYKSILEGENVSEIWKLATARTGEESKEEMRAMNRELQQLEGIAKFDTPVAKEQFMRLASKYSSPTRKLLIQTRDELEAFRSESKNLFGAIAEYGQHYLKVLGHSVQILGTYVVERVIGPAAARGMLGLVHFLGSLSGKIVVFLSGVADYYILARAQYYILKDGFTFKGIQEAVEELIGVDIVGPLESWEHKLKNNYYETSQIVSVDSTETNLARVDSDEIKKKVDFWGGDYINELSYRNPHYSAYVPMKETIVHMRIPGRYINKNNHPYDSEEHLAKCYQLEREVQHMSTSAVHWNLLFKYYPIHKDKNMVRNLVDFPFYERTMKWPAGKEEGGSLYQTQGTFDRTDLDPKLVEVLEQWVQSGQYGTIYTDAESQDTKRQAIKDNQDDFKEYMNPTTDSDIAYTVLDKWINGMQGRIKIYGNDMIVLSPDQFECTLNDDNTLTGKPNPVKYKAGPFAPYIGKRSLQYTYQWFEEEAEQHGRWMYYDKNIEFYERSIKTRKIWSTKIMIIVNTVQMVGEFVDASKMPNQFDLITRVYNEGKQKATYLKGISKEHKEKWSDAPMNLIWNDYLTNIGTFETDESKKMRSAWTYIKENRIAFLAELEMRASKLRSERKEKLMDEYKRVVDGVNDPLDIQAAERSYFMGQLNQVAFNNNPPFTAEELITKSFSGIKANILIGSTHKREKWQQKVDVFVDMPQETKMVRLFVTDKPRTMIVIFEDAMEASDEKNDWITMLTSDAVFLEIITDKENKVDYMPEIKEYRFSGDIKDQSKLMDSDNIVMVFDAVMMDWEMLRKNVIHEISALINRYPDISDIFLTGYGNGAQLAQVAALYIPRVPVRQYKIDNRFRKTSTIIDIKHPHCYLFASKPVGDRRFNVNFGAVTEEVVHVWVDGDLEVQIPPAILPGKSYFKDLYNKEVETMKLVVEKYPSFAGELFLLKETYKLFDAKSDFSFLHLLDDPVSKRYYKEYTIESLHNQIGNIVKASVHFHAYRGEGVFLRLNESGAGAYETNRGDPGNSAVGLSHLIHNNETRVNQNRIHSLDTILSNLAYEIRHHSEDFVIDDKKMSDWNDTGEINGKPNPHNYAPEIPKWLIDELIRGTAHVTGFAHTKHHYKEGTIVPMSDVDKYSSLPNRYDLAALEKERQWAVNKRSKINNGDYHGGYY